MDSARSEAMLAVDLYNWSVHERGLEAFVVHMHIAWTYLLHAEFERDGLDYRYWNRKRTRLIRVDAEPKLWELQECVRHRWPESHPVRRNVEFMIGIRNRIEHRYAAATAVAIAGQSHAHIVNFDAELVEQFGVDESLADYLRFPVFIQSLTPSGMDDLRELRRSLPASTAAFLERFDAALDPDVRDDQRFDYRLHLIPQTGPKSEADLAVHFVRLVDLSDEQLEVLTAAGRTGTVVVRERIRPVVHADRLKPAQVVGAVAARVPVRFTINDFIEAWKRLEVRPPGGSDHPERTLEQYCLWDAPHEDYVYKQAFVELLVGRCESARAYEEFTGRPARPPAS